MKKIRKESWISNQYLRTLSFLTITIPRANKITTLPSTEGTAVSAHRSPISKSWPTKSTSHQQRSCQYSPYVHLFDIAEAIRPIRENQLSYFQSLINSPSYLVPNPISEDCLTPSWQLPNDIHLIWTNHKIYVYIRTIKTSFLKNLLPVMSPPSTLCWHRLLNS